MWCDLGDVKSPGVDGGELVVDPSVEAVGEGGAEPGHGRGVVDCRVGPQVVRVRRARQRLGPPAAIVAMMPREASAMNGRSFSSPSSARRNVLPAARVETAEEVDAFRVRRGPALPRQRTW